MKSSWKKYIATIGAAGALLVATPEQKAQLAARRKLFENQGPAPPGHP